MPSWASSARPFRSWPWPAPGRLARLAWARAGLSAASAVLAFVLAGWGVAALSRITAAAILEYLERAARLSERLSVGRPRYLLSLERIAESLEQRRDSVASSPAPGLDRARSMAEIVRAARAADWVEAETRLNEFEADFPDDPELSTLKEELARSRNDVIKSGLDQLDAARAVNDPDRVLEIYQDLVPITGRRATGALERDLAKWFLSLIHRRLRTGKVQADVVQLAARFAENFATTVEGASVRASLPTLRRSVGLCPRCAQPYTGIADACPKCLKGGTQRALDACVERGDRPTGITAPARRLNPVSKRRLGAMDRNYLEHHSSRSLTRAKSSARDEWWSFLCERSICSSACERASPCSADLFRFGSS